MGRKGKEERGGDELSWKGRGASLVEGSVDLCFGICLLLSVFFKVGLSFSLGVISC